MNRRTSTAAHDDNCSRCGAPITIKEGTSFLVRCEYCGKLSITKGLFLTAIIQKYEDKIPKSKRKFLLLIPISLLSLCLYSLILKLTSDDRYLAQAKVLMKEFDNSKYYQTARKEKLPEIIRLVNASIAIKETSDAYLLRGIAKARGVKINDQGALIDFNKAIKLDPKNAFAYYNRGRLRNMFDTTLSKDEKGSQKALDDYNKAIELDPNYITALLSKSTILSNKGKHLKALEIINKTIKINPKCSDCYARRSHMKTSTTISDYQGAMDDLTQAIEVDPGNSGAYSNRASLRTRIWWFDKNSGRLVKRVISLNDNKKALKDYDKAIEFNPESALEYRSRAYLKEKLGDFYGACLDLKEGDKYDFEYSLISTKEISESCNREDVRRKEKEKIVEQIQNGDIIDFINDL